MEWNCVTTSCVKLDHERNDGMSILNVKIERNMEHIPSEKTNLKVYNF